MQALVSKLLAVAPQAAAREKPEGARGAPTSFYKRGSMPGVGTAEWCAPFFLHLFLSSDSAHTNYFPAQNSVFELELTTEGQCQKQQNARRAERRAVKWLILVYFEKSVFPFR